MPLGELAALATAVAWCFTSLFFAEAARRIGSLPVNLLRLPIALVLLSVALAATGGSLAVLDRRSVVYLAISGVIGLSIGDLAYFGALRRIGARRSLLLLSLAPIFATVAALPVLGEKPSLLALIGIAVTLGGVFWVVLERRESGVAHADTRSGVLRGVFAAACQGVGLVLAKVGMRGDISPLAAAWVRMLVGTAAIWLAALVVGQLRQLDIGRDFRAAGWFLCAGAVCGPFIGVWLSLVAAHLTEVGVASTIMATNPVLIIPVVMVSEGYRPSWRALVGTAFAVVGVVLLFSR